MSSGCSMKTGTCLLVLTLAGLVPAAADVPSTLCGSNGCEYMVQGFSGSYPDERERINWECYDQRTTYSISCTYVRGNDILKYSDVYRKRPVQTGGQQNPPGLGSGGLYDGIRQMYGR
jgi:hypothetical protein